MGAFPSGCSLHSSRLKRGDPSSFLALLFAHAFPMSILNQNKWARKGLLLPCCSFPSSFKRDKLVAHPVGSIDGNVTWVSIPNGRPKPFQHNIQAPARNFLP